MVQWETGEKRYTEIDCAWCSTNTLPKRQISLRIHKYLGQWKRGLNLEAPLKNFFRPLCSDLLYLVERDEQDAILLTQNKTIKPNYKKNMVS